MPEGTVPETKKTQATTLGNALVRLNEVIGRVDTLANDVSDKLLGVAIPYNLPEKSDKPIAGLLNRMCDGLNTDASTLGHTIEVLASMLRELGGKD